MQGAAAFAGAAGQGGIPGILQAGQAPAYPKGAKLHLLARVNFVEPADKMLLAQAEEYGKQMSVEVLVERIGENNVQPRATAELKNIYNA